VTEDPSTDGGQTTPATTRRRLLAGLPALSAGLLSGCSFGGSDDDTPTPPITTHGSLAADFEDGTMAPLEPYREVGVAPQVVEPTDEDGHVLELATVSGRTCAARSTTAVEGELTASVRARRQRGATSEMTVALRLVDLRRDRTVGFVVDEGLQSLVHTGADGGRTAGTSGSLSLDSWTDLSITVRSDELAISVDGGGDGIWSEDSIGVDDRPLAVELSLSAAESAENSPVVWFDDLSVEQV